MRSKLSFLTVIILLLYCCFCGCSNSNDSTNIIQFPSDVSHIDDFKCVVSVGGHEERVIEGEQAKTLYKYVWETFEISEETELYLVKNSVNLATDYIYISFQSGTPLFIGNKEETTNITVYETEDIKQSDTKYYGVYKIYADDYVVFTASPMPSFQKYYVFPDGIYKLIKDMLNSN